MVKIVIRYQYLTKQSIGIKRKVQLHHHKQEIDFHRDHQGEERFEGIFTGDPVKECMKIEETLCNYKEKCLKYIASQKKQDECSNIIQNILCQTCWATFLVRCNRDYHTSMPVFLDVAVIGTMDDGRCIITLMLSSPYNK